MSAAAAAGAGAGGLVGFLSTELASLSAEAKKKNHDVKEGAERLLFMVRVLKEKVSKTPEAGLNVNEFVASELAKSDDVLRPFILCFESKNPKLITIAIGCLQRLIMSHAIPDASGSIHMVVRNLVEQASGPPELQVKILQVLGPMITTYAELCGDVVADSILLCIKLQDSKTPIINNTAHATLRQMMVHVFEKVVAEDEKLRAEGSDGSTGASSSVSMQRNPCSRDAFYLFQDLYLLTNGDQPQFLKVASLSKNLGLELIESVLSNNPVLFKEHEELLALLKERVCSLVIKAFSEKIEFPYTVRLMRIIHVIIKNFYDVLVMECEIFLSMLIKLLEPDFCPHWQRILVIEVFRSLCATEGLVRSIYQSYDANEHSTMVLREMLSGFARIIVAERSSLLMSPASSSPIDSPATPGAVLTDGWLVTAQASSAKMQCIDQFDKAEPANFPDTYIIYLAVHCVISLAESQASFILPTLQSPSRDRKLSDAATDAEPVAGEEPSSSQADILLAIEMANTSWSPLLASLLVLTISSVDDDLYHSILHAYQQFTSVLGLLGLTSHRDAFLTALCRVGIPSGTALSFEISNAIQTVNTYSVTAGQVVYARIAMGGVSILDERGVMCLRSLLLIASNLTNVFDERAWAIALETVQIADSLVASGKMGRRDTSSGSLLKDDGTPTPSSIAAKDSGKVRVMTPAASVGGIGGTGAIENHYLKLVALIRVLFDSTQSMSDRAFTEFVQALCYLAREFAVSNSQQPVGAMPNMSVARSEPKVADEKSFAVTKLTEVALANSRRLMAPPMEIWSYIVSQLIDIAHSSSCSASIRNQVCAALGDIVIGAIQAADLKNDDGVEIKILSSLRLLMQLDTLAGTGAQNNVVLLAEKNEEERSTSRAGGWLVDVQKSALETLNKVLQTSGQNLVKAWTLIFDLIRGVVSAGSKPRRLDAQGIATIGSILSVADLTDSNTAAVGNPAAKVTGLVRVAFPSLQLICSDFLTGLDASVLYECIETLSCFGSQQEDVNISLTATTLLWSISDQVLSRRQALEKEGKTGPPKDGGSNIGGSNDGLSPRPLQERAPSISFQRTALITGSHPVIQGPPTTRTMDALWMHLLAHLSQLCSDSRPEVRNSANQSLFRTIGMNGRRLNLEAWDECIWNVLFPLLERVKVSSERLELVGRLQSAAASATGSAKQPSGTVLSPHHSRNTSSKQWDETKVLTLGGVTSTFINFFPVLVELEDSFDRAWSLFLDYIKAWCLSGSTEVAMAAIKNLRSLVRYHKDCAPNATAGGANATAEPTKLAANVESRQASLWRVAWEAWEGIGLGIIGAASEGPDSSSVSSSIERLSSVSLAKASDIPTTTIHGPFTQDTLTAYALVFPDIYEVISPSFSPFELKRLFALLSGLLLYHTVTPADATTSRIRADMISDLESMTPLQIAVMDIIANGKIDVEGIRGSPEAVLSSISGFIVLPFVQRYGASTTAVANTATPTVAATSTTKGFTYMALAKKSIQALVSLFERHCLLASVYSSGTFTSIIAALSVPMKAKHNCPSSGTKDSTPLWRSAANASVTVVQMGLHNLNRFVNDLPPEVLNLLYTTLIDTFDGFLLSSVPSTSTSPEELAVDESFDISVLETVATDLISHLGQLHVSVNHIIALTDTILRCSKLYDRSESSQPITVAATATATPSRTSRSGSASVRPGMESTTNALGSRSGSQRGSLSAGLNNSKPSQAIVVAAAVAAELVAVRDSTGSIQPVQREAFAKRCLSILFGLCAFDEAETDSDEIRLQIATVVAPMLIEKCRVVINYYYQDRIQGVRQHRIQHDELILVLSSLKTLQLRPSVLSKMFSNEPCAGSEIRDILMAGPSAHLFFLYPNLSDLMCAVSMTGELDDEKSIVALCRACLKRMGVVLGIESTK